MTPENNDSSDSDLDTIFKGIEFETFETSDRPEQNRKLWPKTWLCKFCNKTFHQNQIDVCGECHDDWIKLHKLYNEMRTKNLFRGLTLPNAFFMLWREYQRLSKR